MTNISPRFRLLLATLVAPLVVGGCSVADAGEGNAANEPPVTIRSGGWLIEGSGELAKSHFMGHEEACVESGNKPEFVRSVASGLMRKDLEQSGFVCKGEPFVRSGNLVTSEFSCSAPEYGTLKIASRGIVGEDAITFHYSLDVSKVRVYPLKKAKAMADMAQAPLTLNARRTGSCAAS